MKNIFPRVLTEYPETKIYIVGDQPTDSIRELHDGQNIIVTGRVENVGDYMKKCTAVIVPLLIGGGSRLKILEALAMGKPVVSTSIGCEGLQVKHQKDIWIADTPELFSLGIKKIFEDGTLSRRISENARKTAVDIYNWDGIAEELSAQIIKLFLYEPLSF